MSRGLIVVHHQGQGPRSDVKVVSTLRDVHAYIYRCELLYSGKLFPQMLEVAQCVCRWCVERSLWNFAACARFYAGAVQLANLGALTRIILSGVLLSKF